MSVIILHEKDETNWHSLGLGPLTEAISPMVTRERNGIYELTFQYPVSGKLFKEWFLDRSRCRTNTSSP